MRKALALAALLALTACGGSGQVTVHGTEDVTVNPAGGVPVQQAFPDVTNGSQVTVVDPSGKVIGTGTLSYTKADTTAGASLQWAMVYGFTVTVPTGEARYGIQVGHGRGTVWFTPQQMAKGPVLSLAG